MEILDGRRLPASATTLLLIPLVGLGFALAGLVSASSADAAADQQAARSNSRWLARQLAADGTLQNPLSGALPDHGLMIDVLFAMYATGDDTLAKPIVDYLDDQRHASDYFTWDGLVPDAGFDAVITGGAAAKVLVAAQVAGRDPRAFGGYDMVAETRGAIMRSGPDKGRVSDYSKDPQFADYVSNNANMFGQALGVIGLAGAGENDQLAIDTLLTQQCSEGYFRIFFGYLPTDEVGDHVTPNGYKVSTCDEGKAFDQSAPDGDTTGLALSAMLAARSAGAAGLGPPIAKAVAWLTGHQDASGGWGGGVNTEAPNTNSTGLIVQALADAGGVDAAVDKGVAFLKSAQVTEADPGALGDHIGAIAYTPADYQTARTSGLVGLDTWIRASAQASLGLSQVGFYDLTQGDPPADPSPSTTASKPATDSKAAKRSLPPPRSSPNSSSSAVPGRGSQPQAGTVSPAGRLGRYLAGQLVDGDHVEVTENGKTYVDYAATADLVLALRALDEQPAAVGRATGFLLEPASIQAYAHGAPYEKGPAAYAEPLAKLQIIARFRQAESNPPAGIAQTVSQLAADLKALQDGDGRFVDVGEFADRSQSVTRHVWATLATIADDGSGGSDAALDVLTGHQCTDGAFPAALTTDGCVSGDLPATAAAIVALNGRPAIRSTPGPAVLSAGPSNPGLGGLPPERVAAIAAAGTALAAQPGDGLVRDASGSPDVVTSATTAAGRQSVGLDAGETARALGAMLRADGGMAKPGGAASDPLTSVAVAPGVAGRWWTAAANSPVVMAVRLPLATDAVPAAVTPDPASGGTPVWQSVALACLGFLLAVALFLGRRYLIHRPLLRRNAAHRDPTHTDPTQKAVAS